eukprot:3688670-Rhodomonas_salina.2
MGVLTGEDVREWADAWTGRWIDGWTERWSDGGMEGRRSGGGGRSHMISLAGTLASAHPIHRIFGCWPLESRSKKVGSLAAT